MKISISNVHADAVLACLPEGSRITDRGDHQTDSACIDTPATRQQIELAMEESVAVRGDRYSAIDWDTK